MLGCTGLYHLNKKFIEAREARINLCLVMETYDRAGPACGSTRG